MNEKQTITTLNKFLKGIYMGINGFNRFIAKLQPSPLKETFIVIRDDQIRHANIISERIKILGGEPVKDEGIVGKMTGSISFMFQSLSSEEKILKQAIKGENLYGIRMSEQLVKDQLDEQSLSLVKQILDEDRNHVDQLKKYLHS